VKKADFKKKNSKEGETVRPTNFSIHRPVLDEVGDFLSALIVEFIHYRFIRNDNKPVWLKTDWMHEKLPYISRSGLAKKIKKLVKDGHIIGKKGEGRHYHKLWYSPSADMLEIFREKGLANTAKVYYNLEMAEENLEAAVIYATFLSLLKVDDKLVIDTQKLVEGSGLSVNKVRKAVKWLIDNKKIESQIGFGNKRTVWLPPNTNKRQIDMKAYLTGQLPTESYTHFGPAEDEPTEIYPHEE
jgi:hypothetical protein